MSELSTRREAGPVHVEKDRVLDEIARHHNVAQFVSFDSELRSRFSRVSGLAPNASFTSVREAAVALLGRSSDGSINIRSYSPTSPKAREFVYGLKSVDDATAHVGRLSQEGLYTIINETIDINDGGVSGVVLDDVIEFAPNATPRCVEEPGVAALPRAIGVRVLETVYGFPPSLDTDTRDRVEFSIHPRRRGWRDEHTILWEVERVNPPTVRVVPIWPNRFSRHIGDKAYGLLIAQLVGLNVPRTLVVGRRVAPFSYGATTATGDWWIRTSPVEPQPGRFATVHGWVDPFSLLAREDPTGTEIASVLVQEGVRPEFSGALLAERTGRVQIEGVAGPGDQFMLGERPPEAIPAQVATAVTNAYEQAAEVLGPVKLEWCFDGEKAWILQLHCGSSESYGRTIVPGDVLEFRKFDVRRGLQEFRGVVESAASEGVGIILIGRVGITSHFGDVLRRANVPSRIEL